ncbi:MAG: gamma-glutamylputrescine oxidase [Candidatus Binataceae bacterium]|nr:gamma-glutamylputrescine oxidase [Candidatus Binataceae bacterium]
MSLEVRGLRNQWGVSPWDRTGPISVSDFHDVGKCPVSDFHDIAKHPEVVIIGAGLTGLSTAYHLAKLGVRGVVLEAGLIADGASGRTGGLVLEGTAAGILPQVDSCVAGLRKLVEAEQIDCSLHLPGCWEIEHRRDDSGSMLPWTDAGARVAIAELLSGGTVEPARLCVGLAHAAVAAGAVICEHARVTKVIANREPVVEIDQDRLHPRWVVVACNAWIRSLLDDVPPITSSLTFACATEPLSEAALRELGLAEQIPFYTRDRPYLWGRVTDDRRIVFGTGIVYAESSELESVGSRSRDFQLAIDQIQNRVRKLHPALAKIEFLNSWAGPIAFTEGAVPLLGVVPDCERILVAGAYAGHGVALSVRAGELLANAIVHNESLPAWGALNR